MTPVRWIDIMESFLLNLGLYSKDNDKICLLSSGDLIYLDCHA